MTADVLRQAAALMRERAEAASEAWGADPWHHEGLGYNDAHGMVYDVRDAPGGHVADADCEELAEHIASWHPVVAVAVADWLDFIAQARVAIDGIAAARSRNGAGWLTSEDTASQVFRDMEAHALTVARSYLGDPA